MNFKRKISHVVISTTLGQAGRGIFPYTLTPGYRALLRAVQETGATILTKSATRFPRKGNFIPTNPMTWRYILRLPGLGMLNAYGLTNHGAEAVAPDIRNSCDQGLQVIPNLYPEFIKGMEIAIRETLEAMEIYRQALGPHFWAVELNYSCPNSAEEIAQNVGQCLLCTQKVRQHYPELFLIAKIAYCHPYEFAQELEHLGVNALHAINTIPYDVIFPANRYPRSPLWEVGGGGVSGGPAWAAAYRFNRELRRQVNCFLIMGCGVTSRADVQRYIEIGADAVSICTLALRNWREAEAIIRIYDG